jgi:hypothetical protein
MNLMYPTSTREPQCAGIGCTITTTYTISQSLPMGTWETLQTMGMRAEVRTGQPAPNPQMRLKGVSVAIVLGARESRVHGEGPQLIRCLKVPLRLCIPRNLGWRRKGNEGKGPDRRSPCAVKVCAAVRDVGYLVQPGEVRRETSGPSDSPEGESRRGQEHVREAGDT